MGHVGYSSIGINGGSKLPVWVSYRTNPFCKDFTTKSASSSSFWYPVMSSTALKRSVGILTESRLYCLGMITKLPLVQYNSSRACTEVL